MSGIKHVFRINLWEHAYVHPTSPLWEPLQEYSGDFLVWKGLVPDFVLPEARDLFGGLLWSPEVRESTFKYDFFHRLQTVLLSPQAVVDSWFLQNPPWLQFDKNKNNNNEFLSDKAEMEDITRQLIHVRMRLLPYLYNAFASYYEEGIPPFRPLVMDYPADKKVRAISDQFMVGDCLLAAPLFENSNKRVVYLPAGDWYNFNTNEKYEGGREYEITIGLNEMPLFVKEGTILPLANPVQFVSDTTTFDIICHVYGNPSKVVTLFEDDGVSYNYKNSEFNLLSLWVEKGKGKIKRSGNY